MKNLVICCNELEDLSGYIELNSHWGKKKGNIILEIPVYCGGDECIPDIFALKYCPFCAKKLVIESV